jgi:carbamoyl-phosphate synthase large subunit
MEHIEEAGVHSGDSACVLPPRTIPKKHIDTINEYTAKIAKELKVKGLMNIQYAIADDKVYVLEANPRASRTVPLVSKVVGISMAKIATKIMLGQKLTDLKLKQRKYDYVGVKESVFPFNMFQEVDPVLGPEMRSTGEVLGMADSFGVAYFKAQEAAGSRLPIKGTVLITVSEKDKNKKTIEAARGLKELGFNIVATGGTKAFLEKNNIDAQLVNKMHEGRPNIIDAINNKEIDLIINTPVGKSASYDDSYIRKSAIKYKIPYLTTTAAAIAAKDGIASYIKNKYKIKSLQEYLAS